MNMLFVSCNINMAVCNVTTCIQGASSEAIRQQQTLHNFKELLFRSLNVSMHTTREHQHLIFPHDKVFYHPPLGLTSRVRIMIKESLEYIVDVLLRECEHGVWTSDNLENQILVLCNKYSWHSPIWSFCAGIDPSEYEKQKEVIRFDIKNFRISHESFFHFNSVNRLL